MSFRNNSAIWQIKDYRFLWIAGLITSSCRWLEIMSFSVITWQWYNESSYATGLFALRMVALSLTGIIFSIFSNIIAGQKIMFWAQLLSALSCLISAVCLAHTPVYGFYCLCLVSAVSGGLWSVDWSYRRRMLADSLETKLVFTGLSFDVMANHATRFIGMILGGFLLYNFNNSLLFIILALAYLIATFLIVKIKDTSMTPSLEPNFLKNTKAVVKQAGKSFPILTVLLVTPIFNIFILPFVALIPLLYIDKFNTNEFATGVLTSIDGLGAIFGAMIISTIIPSRSIILFFSLTAILLILLFVCTVAPTITLLTLSIFFLGAASAAYSTLQSSIIYTNSDKKLRSPTFSILTITIGSGFLGGINTSWLGGFLGVPEIIKVMTVQGILAFSLIIFFLKLNFKENFIKNIFTRK